MIPTLIAVLLSVLFGMALYTISYLYQYKKLCQLYNQIERLQHQKCAFIQAQERAAVIERLKQNQDKRQR